LEHLASLRLPLAGRSILEVGAGIGDHTSFFLDRGCRVITTDARPEHAEILRRRYPGLEVHVLDLDEPDATLPLKVEIGYCYGIIYHLARPAEAIAFLARRCSSMLLVETCVSPGDEFALNPVPEAARVPSQSLRGRGCRPTRLWVYQTLKKHYERVYMPTTQPWHEEFPLDWSTTASKGLIRAVFVASAGPLEVPGLREEIPSRQVRH
jgi:SAM-dependent methyltransferase